jgi:hypothetical protein
MSLLRRLYLDISMKTTAHSLDNHQDAVTQNLIRDLRIQVWHACN